MFEVLLGLPQGDHLMFEGFLQSLSWAWMIHRGLENVASWAWMIHRGLENVAAISETITSGKLSTANNRLKYLIVEDDVAECVMCTSIHLEYASHL